LYDLEERVEEYRNGKEDQKSAFSFARKIKSR
jgi:hypothetical protein